MIDKAKCRSRRNTKRTKLLSIRISPDISTWLKEEKLSPTAIFFEAIRELGYNAEAQVEPKKSK